MNSLWAVLSSTGLLITLSGLVFWFKWSSFFCVSFGVVCLLVSCFLWWGDVSREGTGGDYTGLVVDGLNSGILLFIVSEVCFFAAFFWGFFHSCFTPVCEVGGVWPPVSVSVFNPMGVPLLNTIVLLSSGVFVTWSHHSLLGGYSPTPSLVATVVLGFYFTLLQALEYYEATFTISDSVYGSVFFIATGFHGLHVLVGSTFLLVCLIRVNYFSMFNLLGFELSIWYWHFVDVVWIFLYTFIYWWGC